MVDFKDYVINSLLVGLFLICMISFAVIMAQNYGHDESMMKSDKIDFSQVEKQVSQTSADANKWSKTFTSDNLFVVAGGIVLYSIWGIGKLIFGSVIAMATVITTGTSTVLGVPAIAIGVLIAIITISLIFALWKLVKVGQ